MTHCYGVDAGLYGYGTGDPLYRGINDNRTDLFLYCLAAEAGARNHLREYRRGAIENYLRCPHAYELEWGSFLPRSFYRRAMAEFGVVVPKRTLLGSRSLQDTLTIRRTA